VPVPPVAFCFASIALATVGIMLFFLPILGIPLSVIGILAGLIALVRALAAHDESLRWSVAGVFVGIVALGINVALIWAPREERRPPIGPNTEQVPDTPYVPPPAR
jgi:hypothetical protein